MRRRESDSSRLSSRIRVAIESHDRTTKRVIARRCTDKARLHLDRIEWCGMEIESPDTSPLHVRKKSTDQSRRLPSSLLIFFINFLFLFSSKNTIEDSSSPIRDATGLCQGCQGQRIRAKGTRTRPHFASSYNLNNIAYNIQGRVCGRRLHIDTYTSSVSLVFFFFLAY